MYKLFIHNNNYAIEICKVLYNSRTLRKNRTTQFSVIVYDTVTLLDANSNRYYTNEISAIEVHDSIQNTSMCIPRDKVKDFLCGLSFLLQELK